MRAMTTAAAIPPAGSATTGSSSPAASPAARRALVLAGLGTMLTLVAFTAPLATLNATAASLGAETAGRIWILSSMSVGLGAALLSTGTVADDFGRRRTFVIGMVVLAGASFVAALAPQALVFVLARVAQGVGGAAVIASSLGMIAHTFAPGSARARASGVWGAAVGAGIAVGPLVAAGFDRIADWRDTYWLLGVAVLGVAVAAQLLVDESRADRPRGLDVAGVLTLAVGMSSMLAALVEGRLGWTRPVVIVLVAVAVLALTLFVIVQARAAAPMLELSLLAQPAFAAATGAAFATGAGVIGLMSFMPGFLGVALGISALGAAALLFAWSAISVGSALLARRIPARVSGRAQLAIGLFGVAAGQLALGGVGAGTTWVRFVPGLLIAGVASGILNAALGREAVASVPPGRGGMGSGANNTARYVGSAIGVTVVAVLAAGQVGGSPAVALIAGWNLATVVTAAISVAGALLVLAAGLGDRRMRRQGRMTRAE
jgi:MFS family permease